jgi:RHS repeat-associated protein
MSDLDRYQYVYDFNSNRLSKTNVVSDAAGVYLNETYGYDTLNRLTVMQRGNFSGGVITGTPGREMDYTLDPTGNWSAYQTKLNGSSDLSQTRTSNAVNEITVIGGTPSWVTPMYDPAGNMTTMPQPASPTASFTTTYDAWNRMTSLTNTSSGSVTSYQYDGRGRRTVKSNSTEMRHFYYTNGWQDTEERVGASTSMDKQYVWGVRYVDELVCRDDADNPTTPRLYAMQDANFNLTAVCSNTSSGVLERYLFDPYGNRAIMNGLWGVITVSAYDWVIGRQGSRHDSSDSFMIYLRNRYLNPALGAWIQRDPMGYFRDLNLYCFLNSQPLSQIDPYGLYADDDTAHLDDPGDEGQRERIRETRQHQGKGTVRIYLHSAFGDGGAFTHTAISLTDCKGVTYRIELLEADWGGYDDKPQLAPGQDKISQGPYTGMAGILSPLVGSSAPGSTASSASAGGDIKRAWGIWIVPNSHVRWATEGYHQSHGDDAKENAAPPVLDASIIDPPKGVCPCQFVETILSKAKEIGVQAGNQNAGYSFIFRNSNSFVYQVLNSSGATVRHNQSRGDAVGWGNNFAY